jgi:hypothetical protein
MWTFPVDAQQWGISYGFDIYSCSYLLSKDGQNMGTISTEYKLSHRIPKDERIKMAEKWSEEYMYGYLKQGYNVECHCFWITVKSAMGGGIGTGYTGGLERAEQPMKNITK